MAGEINLLDESFIASTNVTALTFTGNPPVYTSGGIPQFTAVVEDTGTGNILDVLLAGTGALILGIAQDGPATGPGQSLKVRRLGRSKAQASGAVTYGAIVYVANASGQLGVAPAAGATNVYAVGKAMTPATAAGDLFEVELMPGLTTQVNA
jgi:hypothetical protein